MAQPRPTGPITTQTDTFVAKVPGERQGTTLLVSGTFNGSTATAGYEAEDGTIVAFTGADASLTADGEISVVGGNSLKIYIITTVANPTGINVLATYW